MATVLHHTRYFSSWAHCFKNEQLNVEDTPISGRSISATDEKHIKAAENLIVEDSRITIQRIAEILDISKWHRLWHLARSFAYD